MTVTPGMRPSPPRDGMAHGYNGHLLLQPTSNPNRTFLTPRNGLQPANPTPTAPPLLPAFLITGLLLAGIIGIITWRHFVERRRLLLMDMAMGEDVDEMWPGDGTAMTRIEPEMWEVVVSAGKQGKGSDSGEGCEWENMMPLCAMPIRAPPKPSKPHYLIPSDRPITFWTRTFGGAGEGYSQFRRQREQERSEAYSRSAVEPPSSVLMSTVAPTNTRIPECCEEGKEEEPIDRVQVVMLVAMPSEKRKRRMERKTEVDNEKSENSVRVEKLKRVVPAGDEASLEVDAVSLRSDIGKKRSLEKEKSGHDPYDDEDNSDDDDNDDNTLQEVFLGTVVLPYVQEC